MEGRLEEGWYQRDPDKFPQNPLDIAYISPIDFERSQATFYGNLDQPGIPEKTDTDNSQLADYVKIQGDIHEFARSLSESAIQTLLVSESIRNSQRAIDLNLE